MKRTIWSLFAVTLILMLLSACSSGGGTAVPATTASTTVSGVAAAGAPIIGFAYLKDSQNNELGPVTIASDGSFSFDLTKLPSGSSAPYYLQAQGAAGGQNFVLHSVAASAGTANINPLTNLVVAQATGKDPATAFADTKTATATQASITAAITAMQKTLAPLLTATDASLATVNPITVSYVADPTKNKLDALFDAVSINVATSSGSSTVSVTDKSGTSVIPQTTMGTAPASSSTTTITQAVTDAQGITTFLSNFATTVNQKGANLATSDLNQYYYGNDSTYGLDDGYNRTQTIQNLVTSLTGKEMLQIHGPVTKVANFAIVNDVTANYPNTINKVYRIRADFCFQDGSYGSPKNMAVVQATAGGTWQFIGNGSMIDVEVSTYANQGLWADGTTTYKTGLYIYLEDVGNQGVNSASLQGPGLPSGGITFSKQATGNGSNTRLALDPNFQGQNLYDSWGQYEMTDTQIGQIVTGVAGNYTLKLYSGTTAPSDGATGLMQTRHPVLAAAPVTNATFAVSSSNSATTVASWFPTANISGLNHSLSSFASMVMGMSAVPFTYSLPKAFVPAMLSGSVNLWDASSDNQYTDMQLALNKTSGSMTVVKPNWTPIAAWLTMEAEDSAHRYYRTVWELR